MKIEITQKCFIGTGENLNKGDIVDVPDAKAEKLIANGFAKKKAAKKVTRDIKQVETPESEMNE